MHRSVKVWSDVCTVWIRWAVFILALSAILPSWSSYICTTVGPPSFEDEETTDRRDLDP